MEYIEDIIELINNKSSISPFIIAIDGRCGSGKTTVAAALRERLGCSVVPMDHFFLREEQRTAERLATAGENIDHERFLDEVLIPLRSGKSVRYRPYNCGLQAFGDEIAVEVTDVIIVDGSYSCNKSLWEYYDMRIFLTTDKDEQMRRIIARDGTEKAEIYRSKWIPMEERYFSAYDISGRCDHRFDT